jgi:hypothetical protein
MGQDQTKVKYVVRKGGRIYFLPIKEKVQSCGLNTALFVFSFFQKKYTPEAISFSLKAGRNWENPISMKQLGTLFLNKSLKVSSFGNCNFQAIRSFLKLGGKRLVVCHSRSKGIGHYYIAVAAKGSAVLFVNPSIREFWVEEKGKDSHRFRAALSGFCLFIQDLSKKKQIFDISLKNEIEVDLGDFIVDPIEKEEKSFNGNERKEIQHTIFVKNTLSKKIHLKLEKGSCSCLKSFRIDHYYNYLPGNSTSKMILTFSKRKMGVGKNASKLVFKRFSEEYKKPRLLKLRVFYNIGLKQIGGNNVTVSPKKIDFGLISLKKGGERIVQVQFHKSVSNVHSKIIGGFFECEVKKISNPEWTKGVQLFIKVKIRSEVEKKTFKQGDIDSSLILDWLDAGRRRRSLIVPLKGFLIGPKEK